MLLNLLTLLFLTADLSFAAKNIEVYPRVRAVGGAVQVTTEKNEHLEILKMPVRDGGIYKKVHTSEASSFRIEMSEQFDFSAFENVDLEFKSANELLLNEGKIRLRLNKGTLKDPFKVQTKSAVAELSSGDFLISFQPKTGELQIENLKGEALLRGLGRTDSVTLKGSSRLTFHTHLEDGEPAYDVLTHGQKVVRGEFSKVATLVAADLKTLDEDSTVKPAPIKKKKVVVKEVGEVCSKPKANFDQCLWEQSKGACFRKRCNAQGQWTDTTRLPASYSGSCSKKPRVANCDY